MTGTVTESRQYGRNYTGIMHNKFIVADGQRVLTGSTNWTSSGLFLQENNVLVLEGAGVAAPFAAEFQELWDGTYGNDNNPEDEHSFTTSDGVPAEIWFGADDNLTGRITGAINAATARIYFAMNIFSTGARAVEIAEALKAAAARGVDVRGVMDDDVGQWSYLVSSPAIPMGDYIPVSAGLLHSACSTPVSRRPRSDRLNNWSTNADAANDENLVIHCTARTATSTTSGCSTSSAGQPADRRFGDRPAQTDHRRDYEAAAPSLELAKRNALRTITGDVAPEPGVDGHVFGDGIVDGQDVARLANYLGIPQGTDRVNTRPV